MSATTKMDVPVSDEQIVRVRKCPATNDDIDLSYQTYGRASDPCILVICGLGVHLGMYAPDFLRDLASRGFYVVVFDNRDSGKSTKMDRHGQNSMILNLFPQWMLFGYGKPVYHLTDMADDAWALLDVLGIARAYLFGTSMGGMIAQCMAIAHPERTLGLISAMSLTGSKAATGPSMPILLNFLKAPKSEEMEDVIAFRIQFAKDVLLPPSQISDQAIVDYVDKRAREQFLRSAYRDGFSRQTTAIARAQDREPLLKERLATTPCLVIHGDVDALVPYSNGVRISHVLPRVRFVTVRGESHYYTPRFLGIIADEIAKFVSNPPEQGRSEYERS